MSKSNEKERWAKIAGLPKKETKQQLDENFVGMGAINQIFPTREPQEYELAFEHYLGEMYESKTEDVEELCNLEKEENIQESASPELIDKIEGLADARNLKLMHDMLRILTTDWMQEGFEKEDIQDYITDFINKI